jgi:hemerythrin-like metal-binding protein
MSTIFQWTKNISVGNDTIDAQHQRLLAQVNKIIDAVALGSNSKELQEVISFFDEYIKEHFSYEEAYMKSINYPEIEEHRKKHYEFITNYNKFKEEFNQNFDKEKLTMEIEVYIGNWWIDHIGKEDKKYQLFLESQIKK